MSATWSLKYRLRCAQRGDARAAEDIFHSALSEHGFDGVSRDANSEISNFGLHKEPLRDDFVVVSGRKVCGFLILIPASDGCGEISKVFVARAFRGQGIGTMLIEGAIQRAAERGYRELMLETNTAFHGARRYYEGHGWTLVPYFETSATRTYSIRLVSALKALRR